ncbi:hypothetical protein LTR56_006152 [Elasticomyces elasticus]|uniref:NADH2 dehydrogenase 14K chain n=1 Tax=Elasticomyces elasticus TaxID=574655 RepID=A0AAN7W6U0_9PEZI|nr:hypothetical protein LTR56_006152 [Elasticomyces elasticus]KAK3667578.1 hypothetical protein LTR22_001393 [Elasticomyces elasticus]KAK4928465.1 hypothetical protein LTR49_004872 [Elasticomyces elasticus]KAK5698960.1 hypothetical protein LTR97_006609 [Elasticomyces elasticus]KAK5731064.1 hypothetical protein LTR15_001002 [Elasticomyces elasticus]
MVNKILFWSGFGLAVRFWQLGIEMRPFLAQPWVYPIYASLGAGLGYYIQGVEDGQMRYLRETRDRLLEKRRRRAERGMEGVGNQGSAFQKEQEGLFASPKA